MKKYKALRYLFFFIALSLILLLFNAIRIHLYATEYSEKPSDVGIVLGAGTSNGKVSAVFRERIHHALYLLEEGKVEYLILTGGFGEGQNISDSQSAKNYALQKGADFSKIFIEEKSTVTFENLEEAKQIMRANDWNTALIVSDPYHMKRAMKMTEELNINATPSPTPTSMYRSPKTKLRYLLYEAFFYSIGVN